MLLTHRGFCEGHVLRRHDTGLLLSAREAGQGAAARGRTLWCFDEHVLPPEALSLCSAALRPLHELETTAAEARWFGPSDPWRGALTERIGAWLGHGACARPCASEPSEAELGHADAACEAHEAVELRIAAHSGRGLHVSRGCASGTLLLREEAFVAVLRRAHARTHCAHCLRPLGGPSCPCHQRAGECPARFCDATCRARAWAAGHALECGLRWAAVAPVTAVLALRALLLSPAAQAHGAQQTEAAGAEAGVGAWARVAAHAACRGLESHQARLGAPSLSPPHASPLHASPVHASPLHTAPPPSASLPTTRRLAEARRVRCARQERRASRGCGCMRISRGARWARCWRRAATARARCSPCSARPRPTPSPSARS